MPKNKPQYLLNVQIQYIFIILSDLTNSLTNYWIQQFVNSHADKISSAVTFNWGKVTETIASFPVNTVLL